MSRTLRPAAGRPWLASGSATGRRKTARKRYRVEYRPGGREEPARLRRLVHDEAARDGPRRRSSSGARRRPHPRPRARRAAADVADVRAGCAHAGRPPVSTSPPRPATSTASRSTSCCRLIGTRRIDTLDAADFIDVVAQLHGQGVARETIRKTLGAGAMVLDHAGRHAEPGARPVDQAAARGAGGDQPADRRARRGRLPADPVEAPAAAALARLVGRPRVERRPDARRRLRRAPRSASGCAPATTKTRKPLWVELPPALAEALSGIAPAARGSRPGRAAVRVERRRRAPHVDREGMQGGRDRRSGRRTICATAGSAAAPARRAVGADRRVRRAARPDRDRQHLHARSERRGRARLREAGRLVQRRGAELSRCP